MPGGHGSRVDAVILATALVAAAFLFASAVHQTPDQYENVSPLEKNASVVLSATPLRTGGVEL